MLWCKMSQQECNVIVTATAVATAATSYATTSVIATATSIGTTAAAAAITVAATAWLHACLPPTYSEQTKRAIIFCLSLKTLKSF